MLLDAAWSPPGEPPGTHNALQPPPPKLLFSLSFIRSPQQDLLPKVSSARSCLSKVSSILATRRTLGVGGFERAAPTSADPKGQVVALMRPVMPQ